MDIRGFDEARPSDGNDPTEGGVGEPMIAIGTDERRMHVRAYNHWVGLLQGRAYPSIVDLDPAQNTDFGPNSVLLDFTDGVGNPSIRFLGQALRDECDLDSGITRISDVPERSLLSRLTDHYLQIIANRAPIGFEAEFVGTRGHNTLYRGILMPFSSDGSTIDFVYGVINWKELVGSAEQQRLFAELAGAMRTAPAPTAHGAVWADGPSAGFGNAAIAPPAARAPEHATLATLPLDVRGFPGDLVVLLARVSPTGGLDVFGTVTDDPDLSARALAAIG
ncbi:hypothetical protein [Sphingomonas sp. NBWT7]|uniref:PAS domain-containing protein n=1 Tax=Sphingomonas sp. NBWT7 TaxID=2596913 RepID=UPI001625A7E3